MLITDSQSISIAVDGIEFHAEVKTIYHETKRTVTLTLKIDGHESANGRYENIEAMRMLSLGELGKLLPDKDEPYDRYEACHCLWGIAVLYYHETRNDKMGKKIYSAYERDIKNDW